MTVIMFVTGLTTAVAAHPRPDEERSLVPGRGAGGEGAAPRGSLGVRMPLRAAPAVQESPRPGPFSGHKHRHRESREALPVQGPRCVLQGGLGGQANGRLCAVCTHAARHAMPLSHRLGQPGRRHSARFCHSGATTVTLGRTGKGCSWRPRAGGRASSRAGSPRSPGPAPRGPVSPCVFLESGSHRTHSRVCEGSARPGAAGSRQGPEGGREGGRA